MNDGTPTVGRENSATVGSDYDLLVVGRPSVDVMFSGLLDWPELGRDIGAEGLGVCAGTSFNTPAAANRLGLRVAYVAGVGNDLWGRFLADEFRAEGLPTDFLHRIDRPLPFVSVAMNFDHDRGFVTYEAEADGVDAVLHSSALKALSSCRIRHLHAYFSARDVDLARRARERGATISFDAQGGRWWESDASTAEALPLADVLLVNEHEALALSGATDLTSALETLSGQCRYIVVKRDERGAVALVEGSRYEAPAEEARIVDSTGAGDCFNAGFLYGWLRGLPPTECLGLGNLCGARVVENFGGYRGCPTEPELLELARSRGILTGDAEQIG